LSYAGGPAHLSFFHDSACWGCCVTASFVLSNFGFVGTVTALVAESLFEAIASRIQV
jgi:hypothetical protein